VMPRNEIVHLHSGDGINFYLQAFTWTADRRKNKAQTRQHSTQQRVVRENVKGERAAVKKHNRYWKHGSQ
jgi:hypothetical protein